MELVDVHCHLDHERFEEDLDEVIDRARKAGIKVILTSGINPSTNRKVLGIMEKYSDIVKATFGIYPIDAIADKINDFGEEGMMRDVEKFDVDEELDWIEKNAESCVGIGEVGLDYKIVEGRSEEQRDVFSKVIGLANKLDKPLIIHSRKAEIDAIDMMEEKGCKKVLMHCFNGKKSLIRRCVELGWYLSVPPVITRLDHFKMLVEIVPLGQLLTETDAPYLSSVAGTRNEPSNVAITIREIAKIKNLSENEVSSQIFNNFRKLFSL